MKRGATKEEIIRTTLDLITRNGLRAVRVDEIAQMLGISKRTLYEMFADKNDLISACLNDMARQQRQHIDADRKRRSGNALQKTLRLVNTYVDSLYKVDPSFLSDIRHKIVFAEYYDEHREFWFRELTRDFDVCRNEGLLLAEIDSRSLAEQLIGTLFELRPTPRAKSFTCSARPSSGVPQRRPGSTGSTGSDSRQADDTCKESVPGHRERIFLSAAAKKAPRALCICKKFLYLRRRSFPDDEAKRNIRIPATP